MIMLGIGINLLFTDKILHQSDLNIQQPRAMYYAKYIYFTPIDLVDYPILIQE